MYFAYFYQNPINWGQADLSPIEACGDRSVIILDGRNTKEEHIDLAREECQKRGYVGFTLNKGECFTRSVITRELERVL